MYHVITDARFPYWVYGAQQDNTTVALASASNEGGLDRTQWYPVGGCESGYVAPSPADPQVVYAGCYGGQITRYDHRTGQERDVNVWPENPMCSRDNGKTWTNVTPREMPEWSLVSQIDVSTHQDGTTYLATTRYKLDDFKPYAWTTTDYGKTWRRITGGLPDNSFVRAVREDPARRGLLYAGTETGAYVSFDDGARWQPLRMARPGSGPAVAPTPLPSPRPPARTSATRPEGSLPAPAGTAPETPAGTPIETLTAASTHEGELPVVPVTDLVVRGDDLV